jgi:hypothetical protein
MLIQKPYAIKLKPLAYNLELTCKSRTTGVWIDTQDMTKHVVQYVLRQKKKNNSDKEINTMPFLLLELENSLCLSTWQTYDSTPLIYINVIVCLLFLNLELSNLQTDPELDNTIFYLAEKK